MPAGSLATAPLPAGALAVDPEEGNSNFTAVFDLPAGERIAAQSSHLACDASYDDKMNSFSGGCSVPLTSITVDNNETKAEHFQQWATNKKSKAKDCKIEAKFDGVKLTSSWSASEPAHFAGDVPFTVCGRARTDGGKEHVEGTAALLADGKTLRIRADVKDFSRAKYQIGPEFTDGWLAKVQNLANVVADKGNITISLTATKK
jgi:hypothetical protein